MDVMLQHESIFMIKQTKQKTLHQQKSMLFDSALGSTIFECWNPELQEKEGTFVVMWYDSVLVFLFPRAWRWTDDRTCLGQEGEGPGLCQISHPAAFHDK